MGWNSWVSSFDHLLVETCHIVSTKWGLQRNRLVKYAPKRPDIWLGVVGLILPHLWWGVIRCASLGVEKSLFGDFTDIHVSKFGCAIPVEENICWLEIPMQNLSIVKRLQSLNYLYKNAPNFLLLQISLFLLMLCDFLVQIAVISVFHHDTEKSQERKLKLP